MPIYEFRCAECGANTEHLMRLSDPDPTECPSCHARALSRVLSAPSFRLAGGGWYETDFKGGKDKRNLAGDGGESRSAEKPDTAAPSKPDAAAPSKDAAAPSKSDTAVAPSPGGSSPKPPSPASTS